MEAGEQLTDSLFERLTSILDNMCDNTVRPNSSEDPKLFYFIRNGDHIYFKK